MKPNSCLAVVIAILALAGCTSGYTGAARTSAGCRLPVVIRSFDPTSHVWSPDAAGFVSYPGGNFTLAKTNGVRYDARRHRWLPAGLPTPDGAGYIYTTNTAVHRVWLDSGVDRTIVTGRWWALGFVADQLYLAEVVPAPPYALEGVPPNTSEGELTTTRGIARTTLSGDIPVFVTHQGGISALSSLGGWGFDRADGMMQAPDRVLHLDLSSGVIEPWLSMAGVMLSGFDAQGHPFVFNHGDTVHVVRLMSKGDGRVVFEGPYHAPWPQPPSYVDGDRVWFSGFSITDPRFDAPALLYEPGVGLHPSVGVPGAQVTVAGPCTKE
jgi:hypothetical protein